MAALERHKRVVESARYRAQADDATPLPVDGPQLELLKLTTRVLGQEAHGMSASPCAIQLREEVGLPLLGAFLPAAGILSQGLTHSASSAAVGVVLSDHDLTHSILELIR